MELSRCDHQQVSTSSLPQADVPGQDPQPDAPTPAAESLQLCSTCCSHRPMSSFTAGRVTCTSCRSRKRKYYASVAPKPKSTKTVAVQRKATELQKLNAEQQELHKLNAEQTEQIKALQQQLEIANHQGTGVCVKLQRLRADCHQALQQNQFLMQYITNGSQQFMAPAAATPLTRVAGNNYDLEMPSAQITNGHTNENTNGFTNGNTSGLTPVFQTEKLLHQSYHEVKTELQWDVHATKDTSSQLPSTAEDALMQLPTMADEIENELFAWVASLEEDSEYLPVTLPDSGSNDGSGSGNSSGVYAQVSADYHPDGMQSAECHADPCKSIPQVLEALSMICVNFVFILLNFIGPTAMALLVQGNLDLEQVQSMIGLGYEDQLLGLQEVMLFYEDLITNQTLLWKAVVIMSCIVGYIGCWNAGYQFKLDDTTAKIHRGTLWRVMAVPLVALLGVHIARGLADAKMPHARAFWNLGILIWTLLVKPETLHSIQVFRVYAVLPLLYTFQVGPVGRANLLLQTESMSNDLEELSMDTLWLGVHISPITYHISSMVLNVSLTDHVLENLWFMGWRVMFGRELHYGLHPSSAWLNIQACICVLTCVIVAAKIKIIQHYYAQPPCENAELSKDWSDFEQLLTDQRRKTQVLHHRVRQFQCGVAKFRAGATTS